MKKVLLGAAALVSTVVLIAGIANAHAPTIAITSPGNGALVEVGSFPTTINVTGSITHVNDTEAQDHNLCAVSAFKVVVTDELDDETEIGTQNWPWANNVDGCPSVFNWSYPFTVEEPGEYTVTVSGRHGGGADNLGSAAHDFEVQQNLIVSFPAAPSVAAKLLADADVPARYGSGKSGGNHIADVAKHMGPGTQFEGVAKKDVAAYAAAVRAFLEHKGAL